MPKYNETITLQTWSDKFARFQANRSFFLFDENGNKLLDGISRWIFMDSEKRKPANVPADMVENIIQGRYLPLRAKNSSCRKHRQAG